MENPGYRALRKGRCSQPNGTYLVTFVTYKRLQWFHEYELARTMSRCIQSPTFLADAASLCFVVMPDHVHMLIQLGNEPLQKVVQRLKSRSAFLINTEIDRKGRFWESGYHDHALRNEESLLSTARYVVGNPIRADLVSKVGDYPYWNAKWI